MSRNITTNKPKDRENPLQGRTGYQGIIKNPSSTDPLGSKSRFEKGPFDRSNETLYESNTNWTSLIPPMPSKIKPTYIPQRTDERNNFLHAGNTSDVHPREPIQMASLPHQFNNNQRYSIPGTYDNHIYDTYVSSREVSSHSKTTARDTSFQSQRSASKNDSMNDPMRSPNKKPSNPTQGSDISQGHNTSVTMSDSSRRNLSSNLNKTPDTVRRVLSKKRKRCKGCGLEITGQFVRALDNAYHVDCFNCYECGKPCSSKFFPYDKIDKSGSKVQVPLCEYDYFKKLDLICFDCNNALRGPYITALGQKYHLEHFRCYVCRSVFEAEESYYEHEGNIYCHFHYSKLFAAQCEGCKSSIVKQFVELYRGGRNQQWHPECYMVHKFWNVCILADSVGLVNKFNFSQNIASLDFNVLRNSDIDKATLINIEQQIENVVMGCWLTLSGFEEATASCISDMLLEACTGDQSKGLYSAGRLIIYVQVLFQALDYIINKCSEFESTYQTSSKNILRENDTTYFQHLRKEPRNIVGKIMSYLALLRRTKSGNISVDLSTEILSVITGCAHYLKLLIRIGLSNSLKLNKIYGSTEVTDSFLKLMSEYGTRIGNMPKDGITDVSLGKDTSVTDLNEIFNKLYVSPKSTDLCKRCSKSIEKRCVLVKGFMWHIKCMRCSNCQELLPTEKNDKAMVFVSNDNMLFCNDCSSKSHSGGNKESLEISSDLEQLFYLLKIAFSRSKAVFERDIITNLTEVDSEQESNLQRNNSQSKIQDYSKTLNDVTKMRTRRQSQKLYDSIKKQARKSVILETPDAEKAMQEELNEIPESFDASYDGNPGTRKESVSSNYSYSKSISEGNFRLATGKKKYLKIKDEPLNTAFSNSLNRTSDLLKSEKSLTLDDIPRIVAAEQAREQRPNAFKHHSSLYQKQSVLSSLQLQSNNNNISNSNNNIIIGQNHKNYKKQNIRNNNNTYESNINTHKQATSDISSEKSQNIPEDTNSGKEFNVKQKYYSELSKSDHFVLRHIAVEALIQISNKINKEELLSLINSKKSPTFWDKFKFGGESKKEKINAVFGVDLVELTKRYGTDSDLGVGPSKLRIPVIIDDIINSLRQKDMSVEGIFRLNGNIKKLRLLVEEINKNPSRSPDFSPQTAVQLAALMKKWLRELPNPLLTHNLFDLWIISQKEQNPAIRKRMLQLTYCLLPRSHRSLLEVLLYFFSWVASFAEIDEETGSKMDIYNLATVIAPNVLSSKRTGDADQSVYGENHFLAIEVLSQLIEFHEEFSMVPLDLLYFYEKCSFHMKPKDEFPSRKEVFAQIEKASKDLPNFFAKNDSLSQTKAVNQLELRANNVSRGLSKATHDSAYENASN